MKYKLTKQAWEEIGKEAGWNKSAKMGEKDPVTFLLLEIQRYPEHMIINAINSLGAESIAGFADVAEKDIPEVLNMCEEYELREILDTLKAKEAQMEAILAIRPIWRSS